MKADDKNTIPRVRIAVLGNSNVGKSGKFFCLQNNIFSCINMYMNTYV